MIDSTRAPQVGPAEVTASKPEDRSGDDLAVLSDELQIAVAAIVRRLRNLQTPEGLSLAERSVLGCLVTAPMAPADLARLERVTPQAMSLTCAQLTTKGLISRARDPEDGRRILFSLTAMGQGFIQSARHSKSMRLTEILAELDADERDECVAATAFLNRLSRRL